MLRSKPIGWITAGTLFCVAGVALACRLRDDKENAKQHRNERDARGRGQLQERHPARLSHGCARP